MSDLIRESKRHPGYIYWWDIKPDKVIDLGDHERVIFVEKDTGERHIVDAKYLKNLLTRISRTKPPTTNWRIKILAHNPTTLRIEQLGKDPDEWQTIREVL